MTAASPSAAALAAAADRAVKAGAVAEARRLLREATALEPCNLGFWMNLAAVSRALGDLAEALAAVEQALGLDPRAFVPLLTKAALLERLGAPHNAGQAYGIALTQAPPPAETPPQLAAAVAHAREVHARYEAELDRALAARLDAAGPRSGPAARRLDAFVGRLAGKRRVFHQEPVQFHYPGLPELEFHDREDFPWLAALEAATPDILAELTAILAEDDAGLEPYVNYPAGAPLDQWAELNRSPAWSSYHLWKDGERVEAHAARAPRTMAAIAQIPQPHVPRRSPAAMFSVLKPRTRIPAHTGVANTRLVMHLPLIVPPGCGFRVGAETREWKVGEAWVFDDTIEHEAWNDSEATRTILICDVWNPRLSEAERGLIAEVMAAMDEFSGQATVGDGL